MEHVKSAFYISNMADFQGFIQQPFYSHYSISPLCSLPTSSCFSGNDCTSTCTYIVRDNQEEVVHNKSVISFNVPQALVGMSAKICICLLKLRIKINCNLSGALLKNAIFFLSKKLNVLKQTNMQCLASLSIGLREDIK